MVRSPWQWALFILGLLLTALVVNGLVLRHEQTLREGVAVLLPLRPVDPRSLMQGDYMVLEFSLTEDIAKALEAKGREDGRGLAVLRRDAQGKAELVRLDGDGPLAPDEVLMRFRVRDGRVHLASHSYFFEEGQGEYFAQARYAEFRLAHDGTALLAGLADADGRPLRPEAAPERGSKAGR